MKAKEQVNKFLQIKSKFAEEIRWQLENFILQTKRNMDQILTRRKIEN